MATVYPGARLDNFYRAFPADSHSLRIAYASIVAPYKGAHVLVEALARLHSLGVAFTAEIAGEALDTAFADKLRDYCAKSGMASKVSFTGFLDRTGLASLFARSNILSFPSQFAEPFGISQVEAMASGLVVVTSGTGGAAEIVRDGQDGLVHRPDDAAALASKLHMLASDPALFQRLQAAGQRRALSFSADSSVRRIEELAEELIRTAAAPAQAKAPAARPGAARGASLVPAEAA
jgi:glycosyltransferase involved in cell wall biosynthesis